MKWSLAYIAVGFFVAIAVMLKVPTRRGDTALVKWLAFFFSWIAWPGILLYMIL